jgi:hypothetical protein
MAPKMADTSKPTGSIHTAKERLTSVSRKHNVVVKFLMAEVEESITWREY